jgi:hypothetical protein
MVSGRFASAIRAFLPGESPTTLGLTITNIYSFEIVAGKVPVENRIAVSIDQESSASCTVANSIASGAVYSRGYLRIVSARNATLRRRPPLVSTCVTL